ITALSQTITGSFTFTKTSTATSLAITNLQTTLGGVVSLTNGTATLLLGNSGVTGTGSGTLSVNVPGVTVGGTFTLAVSPTGVSFNATGATLTVLGQSISRNLAITQ